VRIHRHNHSHLENEPFKALEARDALAVKVLEQRDRIFAGESCKLLKNSLKFS